MPLGPGSRLDANEIVRPLGSGGMGEVRLATDLRLGRKVALEILHPDLTRGPTRIVHLEQEARNMSPEEVRGGPIDHRRAIISFGSVSDSRGPMWIC